MCEDLIITAYRFGVNSLKMEVERTLVACCVVDISNCIDFILFSDKHKCLLLKKHAISYLVARSNDVLNSESSEKLKQSSELMHEIQRKSAKSNNQGSMEKQKRSKKNSNKQKSSSSRAQTQQAPRAIKFLHCNYRSLKWCAQFLEGMPWTQRKYEGKRRGYFKLQITVCETPDLVVCECMEIMDGL